MNDRVEEGGFVEASSGLLLIFAGGAILGPLVVSPFMTLRTPYALFFWIAAFQLMLAAFAVYMIRRRDKVPEAEKSDFVENLNEMQRVFHDESDAPAAPEPAKGDSVGGEEPEKGT